MTYISEKSTPCLYHTIYKNATQMPPQAPIYPVEDLNEEHIPISYTYTESSPNNLKSPSLPLQTTPYPPNPPYHTSPCPLIAPKCLSTKSCASTNRSTQFCVQLSSLRLSFPSEIFPVMHFFQQMSVWLWIAKGEMLVCGKFMRGEGRGVVC